MTLDGLSLRILGPAFLAGLLVLSTHVPMGREVLRRGIIFIDLAVAQTAGLGVIVASTLGWDVHGVSAQLAAVTAAMGAGALLTFTERRLGDDQEALIGVLFVLAATGSIILLAQNPHGGEALKDLLVGQILWADAHTLWPAAVVSVFVLGVWYGIRDRLSHMGFYLLFALAVTASVQLVGVYLVFASLIVPALATRRLPRRRALTVAYIIGALGYVWGLVVSSLFDLPTGAVIVWMLAALGLVIGAWLRGSDGAIAEVAERGGGQ